MNTSQHISRLRQSMKNSGMQAYMISGSDPHQSEYLADHWKIREWISGFTGSAGIVIITEDHAGLWTDSRYYIQAEEELAGSEFTMHQMGSGAVPSFIEWILNFIPKNSTIGVDGWTISKSQYDQYKKWLRPYDISLNIHADFISSIWEDRPPLPKQKIFEHSPAFAGKTRNQKIAEIRDKMGLLGADYMLMPALDDIAWTFNLRGSDVECNPVFIAYACIEIHQSTLFINPDKVSADVLKNLKKDGVRLAKYNEVVSFLNHIPDDKCVLVDPMQISSVLFKAINGDVKLEPGLVKWEKSLKNETEISHFRNVMEKDGAALAEAFYWLETSLENSRVTEFELSEKIAEKRSQMPQYYGESFHAIVGYKSNGAIIHYRPIKDQCATIEKNGMLLVDSGGQYVNGTTDITRTFSLGIPDEEEKRHYTLVLKGMLSLSAIKFPKGTTGIQLDVLARQYLWSNGLDYGHGTGHGVGFFLNVHEPPQGFAPVLSERGKTVIKAGMVTSNEPGYYKQGHYGIRIENLILAQDSGEDFLEFETLTLYPFEQQLMSMELLTMQEINTINAYHHEVFKRVNPFLKDDLIKEWFFKKCQPITI